ncbi:Alpha-N-acetylgalactosaminidase [Planctomycetes bacterium CA13]|uniref:Alpha-N-acetylgalactosaminidase n=1 Tax=Novipirellula herctigrandis TaxID=2527986 RepID=A0A5C5Z8B6_9BACT|nr:Alpha-N-acetylgalactosaminidase [Planctomycetes bacterium CA13]
MLPSPRLVNRRSFMKQSSLTAGVLAASPLIVPSSVLGANPPSETIRMGMIGTGRQCYLKNIPLFQRQPDCRIVAVCDPDAWRMNQAKEKVDKYNQSKHGMKDQCATYADYEDLLARDDIDAVMISTPDHWHRVMAVEAMKAGKDVALEKPIIRTIKEGQQLRDAAEKYNRIFRVDSEFRVGTPARRAYSIVQSGVLGKIHKVYACVPKSDIPLDPQPDMPVPEELDYKRWQGADKTQAPPIEYTLNGVHPRHDLHGRPGWMRKLNYCDGMVTNWGTHLLNGALWCMGLDREFPVEISGKGIYPEADSFWNVLLEFDVTYKYADGVEIIYRTDRPYMRFEGDKGWIEAGFNHFKASDDSLLKAEHKLVDAPLPNQTSEKRDFLDSVKSRKPTWEPADVGHCVTSTCLLGHLAIHLKETLQWDGKNERFIDSERANAMIDQPIVSPKPAV